MSFFAKGLRFIAIINSLFAKVLCFFVKHNQLLAKKVLFKTWKVVHEYDHMKFFIKYTVNIRNSVICINFPDDEVNDALSSK